MKKSSSKSSFSNNRSVFFAVFLGVMLSKIANIISFPIAFLIIASIYLLFVFTGLIQSSKTQNQEV